MKQLVVAVICLSMFSTSLFAQKKGKQLVWEENFTAATLNDEDWNFELGDGCPNICGWGNNERQVYTQENHELKDGQLIITAKKEGDLYTSTRITTQGKQEFQYGYIEIKAKLPTGQGIWPAFWMLGSNITEKGWPWSGEIDILEYVGKEPHMVYTSLHTQDSHGETINSKKTAFENIEEGYHTFAIDWDAERIIFFVDEQPVYTFAPENKTEAVWPFDQPFYILVNMAIGGNFGGPEVDDTIFPQQYSIDYIKVYQY
ncbi:Glycosyl hydrolases family 16 [Pustulibacterium marinum]|uniref:Glycosyl hydrolases family 16 n=1 Tax=Pustulibacterium marinum TaxID=1224947 RepID=A0A1I7F2N5_9FLAO|nr:glycoside hydrolase family 16 protein [Pustulibacterium marinum]SFU30432.1 Glycosyl hydrolases family 16 [Pustulibacterium marinum]